MKGELQNVSMRHRAKTYLEILEEKKGLAIRSPLILSNAPRSIIGHHSRIIVIFISSIAHENIEHTITIGCQVRQELAIRAQLWC